jgi:hypothetical protein
MERMDKTQAHFWSDTWQKGEREVNELVSALSAGRA